MHDQDFGHARIKLGGLHMAGLSTWAYIGLSSACLCCVTFTMLKMHGGPAMAGSVGPRALHMHTLDMVGGLHMAGCVTKTD